jgi:hypothetical protein
MKFYTKTLKKLENLVNRIGCVYGDGATITHKQLAELIRQNPTSYPHINSIINKLEFKVSHGKYLIQMPKSDGIPQDVKDDAFKLKQVLFG